MPPSVYFKQRNHFQISHSFAHQSSPRRLFGIEQPLSAMSWQELQVKEARKDFLRESAIFSHCQVKPDGTDSLSKHWQFVSNITGFHKAEMQCTCSNKHDGFAGQKEQDGSYTSKKTAEYPQKLVERITPFLRLDPPDSNTVFVDWTTVMDTLPYRPRAKFSHIPDGAGLVSSALWPIPFKTDVFRNLRKKLESIAVKFCLPKTIPKYIQEKKNSIPFNDEILKETQEAFRSFFA